MPASPEFRSVRITEHMRAHFAAFVFERRYGAANEALHEMLLVIWYDLYKQFMAPYQAAIDALEAIDPNNTFIKYSTDFFIGGERPFIFTLKPNGRDRQYIEFPIEVPVPRGAVDTSTFDEASYTEFQKLMGDVISIRDKQWAFIDNIKKLMVNYPTTKQLVDAVTDEGLADFLRAAFTDYCNDRPAEYDGVAENATIPQESISTLATHTTTTFSWVWANRISTGTSTV